MAGGRATKPDLKLGVCGEHGGDPESIRFLHDAGLDYVSCSPYRVPVARLEAGRAAVAGRTQPSDGGALRRHVPSRAITCHHVPSGTFVLLEDDGCERRDDRERVGVQVDDA
ncbi:hypothetical protein GCM10025865_27170 [Paraoerskovia sediminicola]|uniref:Pyruvate, phosphate dikinase n=1 Tax=Paraoerskovia sediminicola TaxID=1138587 RepID=A0ABM8G5N2_9CELL|nr:hypothetical protein GCM10025865_27170 [Paraoerskovia sediminicola]